MPILKDGTQISARDMTPEQYEEWLNKFSETLKTSDDTFTPANVYKAVYKWADKHYHISGRPIERPFYPGGDYRNYYYRENCVVVDNPPFSILTKIIDFYTENKIDFFIWCPHLTSLQYIARGVTLVIADAKVIYSNGAEIATGWLTNLDKENAVVCSNKLQLALEQCNIDNQKQFGWRKSKHLTKYDYPPELLTVRVLKQLSKRCEYEIPRDQVYLKKVIRTTEQQKEYNKANKKKQVVYGGGFWISLAETERIQKTLKKIKLKDLMVQKKILLLLLKKSEREQAIIDNLKKGVNYEATGEPRRTGKRNSKNS